MTDWPPLPKRSEVLENLVKRREYADAILMCWGTVEFLMDDVIIREYGLSGYDFRTEPITKLSFEDKLQLQKRVGLLSLEEFKIVKSFQERRNRVFHKEGTWFLNTPENEKQELAEIAINAVQVVQGMASRSNSAKFKELNWLDVQSVNSETNLEGMA